MKRLLYIVALVFSAVAFGQHKVETSIDTTKNKIGAQFNLTLRTNVDTLSNVKFPSGTNFGPMEVIRNYVVDTVKKGDRYELVKRYGLAQFDSGKYEIPRLPVIINNKPYFSESLNVEVANVVVDTLKQKMYEIKPIIEADSSADVPWWLIVVVTFLCGFGAFLYQKWKLRKKAKSEPEVYKTPIEKANALLASLEKKNLWQRGEVKDYYSELTDIARTYIEEVIHIPAMESTTTELISALREASSRKRMTVTQEMFENLERVLRQADLVKFAKSRPLDFEISEDRNKIEKVIVTIDKSIPQEEASEQDDEAFKELQRKKALAKKRKQRLVTSIAVSACLLVIVLVFFIATKGFDYVKDNLIGHPTKELLEGEWVKSTYGNPAISIETPKVLMRVDAEKALPKEAMALLKEFQMFGYGSMVDEFYVVVSTNTYKSEVQIDLSKGVEGIIQTLEARGAQNMIVKQEQYETREGVSGQKAYGTFTAVDTNSKRSQKMYYEILLFGQQNGLQQIIVAYKEGDQYGAQIAERMLNSVELKAVVMP